MSDVRFFTDNEVGFIKNDYNRFVAENPEKYLAVGSTLLELTLLPMVYERMSEDGWFLASLATSKVVRGATNLLLHYSMIEVLKQSQPDVFVASEGVGNTSTSYRNLSEISAHETIHMKYYLSLIPTVITGFTVE